MTEHQTWRDDVYDSLKAAGVEIIAYVPDAGHSRAIERAVADPEMPGIRAPSNGRSPTRRWKPLC
jgi:hypothetical protein